MLLDIKFFKDEVLISVYSVTIVLDSYLGKLHEFGLKMPQTLGDYTW